MATLQNSLNAPLPLSIANGGTGNTAALTDRQVWLGNTSTPLAPIPTTLTAGSGITLTDGSGTLTVAASTAFTWHNTSATTIVMSPFNAYNLLSSTPVGISFAGGFQMGDMFTAVCNGSTFVVTTDDPLSIVYNGSTGHTFTSLVDGSIVTFVCTGLIFNVYASDGTFTLT